MREDRQQLASEGQNCFVCGPKNVNGLGVRFYLEDDVCHGQFVPSEHHCGFDGITHGGIIFSLLDDVMANTLFLQGIRCFTAKANIRFKNQLPTGCAVNLEARVTQQKRKVAIVAGTIRRSDDGQLIAESEATFVVNASRA